LRELLSIEEMLLDKSPSLAANIHQSSISTTFDVLTNGSPYIVASCCLLLPRTRLLGETTQDRYSLRKRLNFLFSTTTISIYVKSQALRAFHLQYIRRRESRNTPSMTTLTVPDIEGLVKRVGLTIPIPKFSSSNVLSDPLDIGHSYIADIIRLQTQCDEATAWNSIQWPNNIYNGDFAIILPKLGHHADSKSLAFNITQRVSPQSLIISL
jgi:hypothetical protein